MALSDILLRTLTHPTLSAKGSALTWVEEDTNFVEIYEALITLNDFTNSGVAAYDGGTTYNENDIVTYNGLLYTYINPVSSSGNAPPNPTYWELTAGASLAHPKDKDSYLDFGGTYQVSAQEIRELLDTPTTEEWGLDGNTITSRKVFGSTSGAYGWDYKVNNTVYGGISNSGKWFWGTTSAFTDTDHSFKGSGNTSGTYNTQWRNSDNSILAWINNVGAFSLYNSSAPSTPSGSFINWSDGGSPQWKSAAGDIIRTDTTNRVYRIGIAVGENQTGTDFFGAGTSSGFQNTGNIVVAFGNGAAYQNSGNSVFAFGFETAYLNSGAAVFAFGNYAAKLNSGSDVSAIGGTAAQENTGSYVEAIGSESARGNQANHVKSFGYRSAYNNTLANVFTVSVIDNIFWNNIGDQGFTTLQTVTQQTAMAANGTNQSAAASVFKIAQARGTGNAAQGNIIFQKANVQASGTTRHTLTDWWYFDVDGNTGIGGNSYGSGAGVVFVANAGTDASANPTGGAILQAKSGRLKVMETDGSLSWLVKAASATKTTAGAPYTNDGYIEVIIDGNTFKLMTTA